MRSWFNDLKMRTKILGLLGLLAAVNIATAFYAGHQMRVVDDADSFVIEHPDKANLAMARANRSVMAYYGGIYQLASSTTEDGNQTAFEGIKSAIDNFDKFIAEAKSVDPQVGDGVNSIVDALHTSMEKDCGDAIKLGSSTDSAENAKAVALMQTKCGPQLLSIIDSFRKLADSNVERAQRLSDETTAMISRLVTETILAIIALVAVIGGLSIYVIGAGITKPLGSIENGLKRLADGQLQAEVTGAERADEIGAMARAFHVLRDGLNKARDLEASQRAEAEARIQRGERVTALVRNFENMIKTIVTGVASAATELQSNASTMSAASQQTQQQSSVVAAATQEASANVQAVAGAAEEMTATSREIGEQVMKASKMASDAVAETSRTSTVVDGLAGAAQRIGDVISLIQQIAGQTNLLALNATIEAARAGEAGKGFAVVASEVKSLANQTAKATEEISAQIAGIQSATTLTVDAIKGIGGSIGNVNQVASAVAAAVQQQVAATGEISSNVQQASQGTDEIARNISGVAEAAEQTGQAANMVLSAANQLAKEAETLRREVDQFLVALNAA